MNEYNYKWYINGNYVSPLPTLIVLATEGMQNAEIYVEIFSYVNAFLQRSTSAFLHIRPPPAGNLPPIAFNLPSEVTLFAGDYVDLSINNETVSGAEIQWYLDNVPIEHQTYPQIHLKMSRDLNGAELSVVVKNKAGSIRQAVILHVYWAKWLIALVGGVLILFITAIVIVVVLLVKRRKRGVNPYQLVNDQMQPEETDLFSNK
jgi:hypothetical protein